MVSLFCTRHPEGWQSAQTAVCCSIPRSRSPARCWQRHSRQARRLNSGMAIRSLRARSSKRLHDPLVATCGPALSCGSDGRCARSGRNEAALAAYDELAQLGSTPALGLPAALAASEARCSVLQAMGRTGDLGQEAARMAADLWSRRYVLLRPVWQFHLDEARRWGAADHPTASERQALALSSAAHWIHDRWVAGPASAGRRALKLEDQPLLIVWTATADRLDAVLAGPDYIESAWLQAMRDQAVHGGLADLGSAIGRRLNRQRRPTGCSNARCDRVALDAPRDERQPDCRFRALCSASPPAPLRIRRARPGARRRVVLHRAFHHSRARRDQAPVRVRLDRLARVPHAPHLDSPALGDAGQGSGADRRSAAAVVRHPLARKRAAPAPRRVAPRLRAHRGGRGHVPIRTRGRSVPGRTMWLPGSGRWRARQGFQIDIQKRSRAGLRPRRSRRGCAWRFGTCSTTLCKYSAECRTVWVETRGDRSAGRHPRAGPGHRHPAFRAADDLRQVRPQQRQPRGWHQGHRHRPHAGPPHRRGAPRARFAWRARRGSGSTFTILLPLENA